MQQYMETKKEYSDCILFYRLGDFYEMFFEDAITAARELEITLTGKNCGLEERAPMCGIPYHAVDNYLNRLVQKGYKVAICEQVEDPKLAKGIVKREVIRIVTPGTNLNVQGLEEGKNNFIMTIVYLPDRIGLSIADVTTGEFRVTEVEHNKKLVDEIYKYMPSEIICNEAFLVSGIEISEIKERLGIAIYPLEPWYFDDELCKNCIYQHFQVSTVKGLGLDDFGAGVIACGALLQYLHHTQKISLAHLSHVTPYVSNEYMLLDNATRRNLELTETMREKQKRGSLLWVLDKTKTAMGARTLRSYLEQPLIEKEKVLERLDAIEEINKDMIGRDELREYLQPIYDLERLLGKVSYKTINPRDLIALKSSLEMLPHIRTVLQGFHSETLEKTFDEIDSLEDIYQLIQEAIEEEPPLAVKEGGIIKQGFQEDIDTLRLSKTEGKTWLA